MPQSDTLDRTPSSGWQTPWLSPSSILHAQDWSDVTPQHPPELPPQSPEERECQLIALRVHCNPLFRGVLLALASVLVSALVGLAALPLAQPQPVSWWILELILEVAHV